MNNAELIAFAEYIQSLLEAEYKTYCLRRATNLAAYKAQLIAAEVPGYNTPEFDQDFAEQPSMVGMMSNWTRDPVDKARRPLEEMQLIADMISAPFGGNPGLWPDVCVRFDTRLRVFRFIDPADAETVVPPTAWAIAQANHAALTTSQELRDKIKKAYEGLSDGDRKELEPKPDESADQHRNRLIRWAEARRKKRLGNDDAS